MTDMIQISYKDLTKHLTTSSFSTQLVIVPYSWVDLNDGSKQAYTIVLHGINGFIRDFGGTVSKNTAISTFVSSNLESDSLGVIQVFAKEIEENATFFAGIQTNFDGSKSLDPNSYISVFVNLGDSNRKVLNSLIEAFSDKMKSNMRHYPNASNYNTNLIYLSQVDLFYICRGTTFCVEDNDGAVYDVDVGDGMFLEDDLLTIYRPKTGDIPVSRILNGASNAPFSMSRYTDVSINLSNAMNIILNDDKLHPFGEN